MIAPIVRDYLPFSELKALLSWSLLNLNYFLFGRFPLLW